MGLHSKSQASWVYRASLKINFWLGNHRQYNFQVTTFCQIWCVHLILLELSRDPIHLFSFPFFSYSVSVFETLSPPCNISASALPVSLRSLTLLFSCFCFLLLLFVSFPSVPTALLKYNLHILKGLQLKKCAAPKIYVCIIESASQLS